MHPCNVGIALKQTSALRSQAVIATGLLVRIHQGEYWAIFACCSDTKFALNSFKKSLWWMQQSPGACSPQESRCAWYDHISLHVFFHRRWWKRQSHFSCDDHVAGFISNIHVKIHRTNLTQAWLWWIHTIKRLRCGLTCQEQKNNKVP